jgi:hypothetical protein
MSPQILKKISDNLIIRRATSLDTQALVKFNGRVHAEPDSDEPFKAIEIWVHDLMTQPHPTFDPKDFTIVEDIRSGKIVSSLCLINQTWRYDGIEFGVGRPELVGTDPEYRRRGLIKAQMDLIHAWSQERGHKLQAIIGIPFYYRLFGYEMALSFGGGRVGYLPHTPKLEQDENEQFKFRPGTEGDIPFIKNVYAHALQRNLVGCLRDDAYWKYELTGKSKGSIQRAELRIIEHQDGEPVGFIQHAPFLWNPVINLYSYELKPEISWFAVTPSVIRYLVETGKAYAAQIDDLELAGYYFGLGREHPAYQVLPARMPRIHKPYSWYLRVANIPDFVYHIGPVLERRLADSYLVGYDGELKINFYRSAIRLSFERGILRSVKPYQPDHNEDADVFFPELTFLRVLFGYESFDTVENVFPDCFARSDRGRALMPVLFPCINSHVWAIA